MKTKSIFYIYGEPTTTISFKVPESKRKEIMEDIRENVLSKYENPKRMGVEVEKQQDNNDIVSMNPLKREFSAESIIADIKTTGSADVVGDYLDVTVDNKPPKWAKKHKTVINKVKTEEKFERIGSLPLGTELVEGFGSKGAIRKDENGNYYTKRTYNGKLEILKHKDYVSALLYCEENFK